MRLVLRFIDNQRCQGCGAIGWVEEKALLCFQCKGLQIEVEARKQKLTGTLRYRFACLGAEVGRKLRMFNAQKADGRVGAS